MRAIIAAAVGLALACGGTATLAESDLPPGAEELFVCGTVFTLHAGDLLGAGDEPAADEFYHLGDMLTEQASATLEAFGYTDEEIDEIAWNVSMDAGFSYESEGQAMLADCLESQKRR